MRVAMNACSLSGPLTGLGQYTFHLTSALMRSRLLEMDLFYEDHWGNALELNSTILSRLSHLSNLRIFVRNHIPFAYDLKRSWMQLNFSRGLSKKSCDLYHEPNFLAFDTDLPTVISVHDLSWIKFPDAHPKSRVRAMNKYFERGLDQSNFLITDSDYVREEVMDVFGYPQDRIKSIPLGVDASFMPRSSKQTFGLLERHRLSHGNYILLVGTIEPRKNIDTALNAFMALPKKVRLDTPLVLVGMRGWLGDEAEARLSSLVGSGEVRRLGYVAQADLPILFSGALTLVFPSIYEGFGLPPLEAMASGVPVITSNVSSIPEVVGAGGLMFNPHDVDSFSGAMRDLIADRSHRDELASLALDQSKKFSWDRCAVDTLAVYQHAVS